MTLKEDEIRRKEMAKILPSIQIGYIDKSVKEYLNNTLEDIEDEVKANENSIKNNTNEINQIEKGEDQSEKKLEQDSSLTEKYIDVENNIAEANHDDDEIFNKCSNTQFWDSKLEDDIPSSAGDDVQSFLSNLIHRVDGEKNATT